MKIIAKGVLGDETKTVIFEDGKFNSRSLYLDILLEEPEPIGGTYYPEKYEPLNVYYTLKDRYFDKLLEIEVEGDLGTIPFEKGVIY